MSEAKEKKKDKTAILTWDGRFSRGEGAGMAVGLTLIVAALSVGLGLGLDWGWRAWL